ncbi:MAG: hypothetical protein ABIQ81_07405 [Novosphingobium sp.]
MHRKASAGRRLTIARSRPEISAEARMPEGADFAKIKRYVDERPPADPAEVVAVVAFISSPAASGVHGAIWTADGGVTVG